MKTRRKTIYFIGLGVGKLAERLYGYLRSHPELFIPKQATNFFCDVEVYAKGLSWYENHFSLRKKGQKCGELSFNYLINLQGPKLIAEAYPEAKLFVVISNPLLAFKLAYLEAIKKEDIDRTCSPALFIKRYPEVLTRICFGRQLTQYLSYYSSRDLLVIFADEVAEKPLEVTKTVFQFLEVNDKFVPIILSHLAKEEEEDFSKTGFIKRNLMFLIKNIKFRFKEWRRLRQTKEPLNIILDRANRVKLSPDLEIFLKQYFHKDVSILSSLLHRDLNKEWDI